MQEKKHIHIVSQNRASIGEVTRDIVEGLKNDFIITEEVKGETPEKKEILLCHYTTPKLVKHPVFSSFKHRVLIFPVDGTKFTEGFIETLNSFDLIITPATAGKKILEQNKVTVPIIVIPNFFHKHHVKKPDNLSIKNLDKEIEGKYVYYYEAMNYPRKGFEELLKTYVNTWSSQIEDKNTVLLIKTDDSVKTYEWFEELKKEIFDFQKQYKFPAKIVKISQHIPFEDLQKIWHKIDCYVHPARIEGFGIPLLRMAVIGKPIIVLENSWSGYNDYLKNYPFLIKTESEIKYAKTEVNKAYDTEKSLWRVASVEKLGTALILAKTTKFTTNIKPDFSPYTYYNVILKYRQLFDSLNCSDNFIEAKLDFFKTEKPITGVKYICPKGHSGYAEAAKDYIIAIYRQKIPITVEYISSIEDGSNLLQDERDMVVHSLQNNPIEYNKVIIHSTPEFWEKYILLEKNLNSPLNKNKSEEIPEIIGMTVWETDKLDDRWIPWINQVDKVIVPCKHNLEVLENCGVVSPIGVIPHIYKPLIKTDKVLKETENTFNYYTIGQWSERKGVEDTIKAYLNTFTKFDPVSLIVKTFGNDYSDEQKERIRGLVYNIIKRYKNPAKVVLILDKCTPEEMSIIHNSGNCYVSLCKSEGWGLGAFDAVGYGKPVIITGYGGQVDFIKQQTVNYELKPVEGMEWIPWYHNDQKWGYPDLHHASVLMKEIAIGMSPFTANKVDQQIQWVRTKYTYEVIGEKLLSFLNS